jgi:hypothetical protein
MHKLALPIFLFFFTIASFAQDEAANYYWVQFSDKNGTNYSIDKPHEFLSDRALNRRQ